MMLSFKDSNQILAVNHPKVIATVDTYNGNQFAAILNTTTGLLEATPYVDVAGVQAGDPYIMLNALINPEEDSSNDYHVEDGDPLRAFRLADLADQEIFISSDLCVTAHASVAAGDDLIPLDSVSNATYPMLWVKGTVTGYPVYLEVMEKTRYGQSVSALGVGYRCIIRVA